jgi:hypothetical protein
MSSHYQDFVNNHSNYNMFGYQSIPAQEPINNIEQNDYSMDQAKRRCTRITFPQLTIISLLAVAAIFGTVFTVQQTWSSSASVSDVVDTDNSASTDNTDSTDSSSSDSSSSSSTSGDDTSAVLATVDATLRRMNYEVIDQFKATRAAFASYRILQDHGAVIEPYASMILEPSEPNDSSDYTFTVCKDGSSSDCYEGSLKYSSWDGEDELSDEFMPVTVPCEPYDTFTVSISEVDSSSNKIVGSSSFQALCMYVRRDIMLLTSDDLAETMDTMYSLWSYSEEEGQSKFGENFHSAVYFSEAHFFSAAQHDSDHIHEVGWQCCT